jgi:hypothetical protein
MPQMVMELLRKMWETRWIPLIAFVFCILIVNIFYTTARLIFPAKINYILNPFVFLIIYGTIIFAWYKNYKLPKNTKNKIGIAFSVICENNFERNRWGSDIFEQLKLSLEGLEIQNKNKSPFCNDRNLRLAMKEILHAKSKSNPAYLLSRAFIYAYKGSIDKADKIYEEILSPQYNSDTINILQIEIFIQNVLHEEPNKTELYYCLGLINFKIKEDYKLAIKNFNKFVINVEGKIESSNPILIEKAKSYIISCQKKESHLV